MHPFYTRDDATLLVDARDLLSRHRELIGEGTETIAARLSGAPDPAAVAAILEVLEVEGEVLP